MRRCYCVITKPLTRGIKKMEPQKRDNYIDFIKGLAVIAIVFIHTVFWSGGSPVLTNNIINE